MSNIKESPSMLLKIVFVGDSGVGKTSLLRREAEEVFTTECVYTIGVDFRIKNYQINKISAKVQLWDTAGQ
jgi:small GTP-binding protein